MIAAMTSPAEAAENKQVVMIVINQVNYNDLLKMDAMEKIIEHGGIGLLNTRTAGSTITPKAYATIGAGTRAEGNWITSQAYPVTPESQSIYHLRTGKKAPENGIVNLEINRLIAYNEAGEYGAVAGQLGTLIQEAGRKTAVYGNMDIGEENRSPHVLIAMDQWGRVDRGIVSHDVLIDDISYPGGIRTNYAKIYEELEKNQDSPGLTVIETGDITRLEEEKDNLSPDMFERYKEDSLQEMNLFLEDVKTLVEKENKLLIIVTPFSNTEDIKEGYKLTPIVLFGEGVEKGLLTSSTTRRTGIIGNVDIAPTILEYLDIEENHMVGNPIGQVPAHDHLDSLLKLNDYTVAISNNRLPVLTTFVIYQIVLLIIALIMILFKGKINSKFYPTIKNLLLSGLVIPVVLLFLPVLGIKSLPYTFIAVIAVTALISWITYYIGKRFNNPILPIVLISLLMTIGLVGDIVMGSPLIRSSLFGYDPIIGARYYGIGNEFMGVLVGAALVLFLGVKELFNVPKGGVLGLFALLIIAIGYPQWGANVGGTLTATAASAFIFLRLYKIKISWKQILIGFIGMAAAVAIMAVIDTFLLENQSHLARAIQSIKEGGIVTVFMIISRKVSMNIRLFKVTIWSKVLVTSLIVFAILFYKPYEELKKVFDKYPYLSIGWSGIVVASITGFMVNDSGVVAAATSLIYLSFSLLYIMLQEPHNN